MNLDFASLILRAVLLTSLLWATPLTPALAAGVVGTGTPASCTEAALNAALAGGGTITFNCGAAPHTILSSSAKAITLNTTIDGGGTITLDGQDGDRLFVVSNGAVLVLRNITLINGFSSTDGGAIRNGALSTDIPGSVTLENSTIRNSRSWLSGGAIVSTGPLTITNSLLENNQALNGGALYPRFAGARTTIINSTLRYNKATDTTNGWGGAMLIWDGASVTIEGSEIYSNTAQMGGGILAFTNSSLTLNSGALRDNSVNNSGGGLLNAGTATLTGVTVSGNSALGGGGLYNSGTATLTSVILSGNSALKGGGILNYSLATLTNVTLSGNMATNDGGGLSNNGTATLSHVTLSGNSAASGGGLFNAAGGTTRLNNVTLSGNEAYVLGGGIENLGAVTLTYVALRGNIAFFGGGIVNYGPAELTNVTLSGNSVGASGGGLYNQSTATLTNVTLSSNSAGSSGGGIYNTTGYTVTLKNTIVAYSPTGGNCGGAALTHNNSDKYSLSSDNTCVLGGPGSRNNVDPLLSALGNYGGSTQVHMPKSGSPAIDGVSGSDAPATDQRDKPRPQGGGYDIGAVERQPADSDLAPRVYLPLVLR